MKKYIAHNNVYNNGFSVQLYIESNASENRFSSL